MVQAEITIEIIARALQNAVMSDENYVKIGDSLVTIFALPEIVD